MEITITEQQKKRLGKLSKLIMLGDAALTPVTSVHLGLNRIYVETDY